MVSTFALPPKGLPGLSRLPEFIACGILGCEEGAVYIKNDDGGRLFLSEPVWGGYLAHWLGRRVRVHRLPQRDYENGALILLLAPDEPAPPPPYIILYYNERLPGYLSSLFGHIAINVDSRVFNFSEKPYENEEMSVDEYLYRPALGEFSSHPESLTFNLDDAQRPYYYKFGRRFMRTIHALYIEGLDTTRLTELLRTEIEVIHQTPVDPRFPHKYRDFRFFRRNCTTIIRDALRQAGLTEVSGFLPRELFINTAYQVSRPRRQENFKVCASRMEQLKVPEQAYCRPCPILNPMNRLRLRHLSRIPGAHSILEC